MTVVFGIILALIALIFLAVGYMALVGGLRQKKRCSASAPGKVALMHTSQQARGRGKGSVTIYIPEFHFTVDGKTHTHKASFGSMRREFKEGQAVIVCYDPADPDYCYVADDPNTSFQGGVMCLVIGVLLAIGAVAAFV